MKRLYTLLLILVLTLGFSASALAQDTNCGDLSPENCEVVLASQAAMSEITSATQAIGFSVEAMAIPGTPGDLTFDFTLETSSSSSDEAMQMAMEMQQMSAEELADLYANPDELVDVMGQLLQGVNTTLSMTMDASDDLASLISASSPDVQFPTSFELNLALVDGILYVDTSTLGPLLEGQMGGMAGLSGWVGIEFMPLLEQALMQPNTDPAMSGAVASSMMGSSAGGGPLYGQIATVDPMGAWLQFLNIERLEDEEGAAVFETTVDFPTLLESDYFGQLVGLTLMQTGTMASQAEVDQIVQLARAFAPALLDSLELSLVESVNLEDSYLSDTSFVFDLDLAPLLAMSGATGMDTAEDAYVFAEITTAYSEINEDLGIEAPSNAFVVPAQMLEQLLSGGM